MKYNDHFYFPLELNYQGTWTEGWAHKFCWDAIQPKYHSWVPLNEDIRDKEGYNILNYLIIQRADIKKIIWLINNGANVNKINSDNKYAKFNGYAALPIAVMYKSTEVVDLLLKNGDKIF